jgi:hypothetical protein
VGGKLIGKLFAKGTKAASALVDALKTTARDAGRKLDPRALARIGNAAESMVAAGGAKARGAVKPKRVYGIEMTPAEMQRARDSARSQLDAALAGGRIEREAAEHLEAAGSRGLTQTPSSSIDGVLPGPAPLTPKGASPLPNAGSSGGLRPDGVPFHDVNLGEYKNAMKGRTSNCVNCAAAMDSTLAGNMATAATYIPTVLPDGTVVGMPLSKLKEWFPGRKFRPLQSLTEGAKALEMDLLSRGPGSRAIVYVGNAGNKKGHVMNAYVTPEGVFEVVDGQEGVYRNLGEVDRQFISWMPTN